MAWLTDYPREKVNWFPTIDFSKCVKCGICMNCGKQVYSWTKEGPVVSKPLSWVVGCTACANLCQGEVITFPDKNELRALYKNERLWAKVTVNGIRNDNPPYMKNFKSLNGHMNFMDINVLLCQLVSVWGQWQWSAKDELAGGKETRNQ